MTKHREITGILTQSELDACGEAAEMNSSEVLRSVVHAVAEATGISAREIYGRDRSAHVSRARQIVMLAANERGVSLSEIGRSLGRDHTTVAHGVAAERARRNG